jgi:pimeloyl-ACP methyl ester carboxylesterase
MMVKKKSLCLLVWGMIAVSSIAHAQTELGKTLDFGEHTIYYEVRGHAGKTLVFIHGWTASLESWKFQLDAFPEYRVIAIDLPGNGRSSKHEVAEYTMELFADSVHAVLTKEQVANAVFFGHSMGFSVVEVLAQKYPEMCLGIGCIDGAHFEVPDDEEGRNAWVEYNRSFAESLNEETGRDAFLNMLFLPDTPRILREEVFAMSRRVPLSIGKAMIAGVEHDMQYWAKRTMAIPCLAVYSPVYQLTDEYEQDFKTMYPQVEYHKIDNVSHFLMLEIPYVINQMIHDYLENSIYHEAP